MFTLHFLQDHIAKICDLPEVQDRWASAHNGKKITEEDIDRMYAAFTPMQTKAVVTHAAPIADLLFNKKSKSKKNLQVSPTPVRNCERKVSVLVPARDSQWTL